MISSGCATVPSQTTSELREARSKVKFESVDPAPKPVRPSLTFSDIEVSGKRYVILPWTEGWELKKYLDATDVNRKENENRINLLNQRVQQLQDLFK